MNDHYIRLLYNPKLENPLFICGLPGIGNIGKIAAGLLIKFTQARLFAEFYSSTFPDFVLIDKDGVCRPPRYEFYESRTGGKDLIILTGDAQPSLEDVLSHYEVCGEILRFIRKYGCRFIVTLGGVPTAHAEREVYVAATSPAIATEYAEEGAIIYRESSIVGASGLLLGLAKKKGLRGVCLLGSTPKLTTDRESAINLYKFLTKTLKIDVNEGL